MDELVTWLYRGVLGTAGIVIFIRVMSSVYALLYVCTMWLPRSSLVWVPGIDILWIIIFVVVIGRILSLATVDIWIKRFYSDLMHRIWHSGYFLEADCPWVAFPSHDTGNMLCGYKIGDITQDGKVWAIVIVDSNIRFFWARKYIVLQEKIIILHDNKSAHISSTPINHKVQG